MKVYIQRNSDSQYVTDGHSWTEKKSMARAFDNSITALDYCLERNHKGVDIVMGFDNEEYDLRINHFAEF